MTAFAVSGLLLITLTGAAIFGGTAAGTETAPENTAAPSISPSLPILADTATAGVGSWTGSPTSFTYAWYRCNGTGSCKSISGATGSSYVPRTADVGSALRVLVTATNGAGSGSALSSATSAAVGSVYWYSCTEVGGTSGGFEDAACTKGTKGPFEWTKVTTGTSTPFQLTGSSPVVFGWVLSGVQISVSCSSQSGSGTLENPSGGGAGKISSVTLKLSGCTVTKPAGNGCEVTGGSITTNSLGGTASEPEGKPQIKIQSVVPSTLFNLTMQGCSTGFLNNTFAVNGSFQAFSIPATSSLEFTKASSTGITIGGNQGSLEGTLKANTTTGTRALKIFAP